MLIARLSVVLILLSLISTNALGQNQKAIQMTQCQQYANISASQFQQYQAGGCGKFPSDALWNQAANFQFRECLAVPFYLVEQNTASWLQLRQESIRQCTEESPRYKKTTPFSRTFE